MTASCVAITLARLASSTSSQPKKTSGSSATPLRDNNSYTTTLRTPHTSDWSRFHWLTDRAAETHRRDAREIPEPLTFGPPHTVRGGRQPATGHRVFRQGVSW